MGVDIQRGIFMGRPLRIEYSGAWYHVTSRGNERKDVFKSRADREKFLSYLESASVRYGAVIHAFCLMSNHYHLLLETPSGNLSQIMRHINGAYTNYFNAKRKRAGHLFQGRYKAILVEADQYAKELSRYLHLNPVRAGMVDRPEAWEWSSYRDYTGQRSAPEWLRTGFILGYFGTDSSTAREKYRLFVGDLLGREYESPLEQAVASAILGSEVFVARIDREHLSDRRPDRNLPDLHTAATRVTVERIREAIGIKFADDGSLAAKAGIYLCHRYSGAGLREIGAQFGVGESAVSQTSRRFAQKIVEDGKLRKRIDEVLNFLEVSRCRPDT